MTISNPTRGVRHVGNGSATVFPFTFLIPEGAEEVYVYDLAENERTLLDSSAYEITGLGDPDGGTVTYEAEDGPLEATHALLIVRNLDYEQSLDIPNQGGFHPNTLEQQLDEIVMQIQQVADEAERALKVEVGVTPLRSLPSAVAGRALVWRQDLTGIENAAYSPGDINAAVEEIEELMAEFLVDMQALVDVAEEWGESAEEYATLASEDAADAAQSAQDAEASAVEAQVAAAAALIAGNIYESTAAGLAATADQGYFSVASADPAYVASLYKDNAGVAELIGQYASLESIEDIGALATLLADNLIEFEEFEEFEAETNSLLPIRIGDVEVMGFNEETGELKAILDPEYFHLTEQNTSVEKAVVKALGARGTITQVREVPGSRLLRYMSDVGGQVLPYLTRGDVSNYRVHLLDTVGTYVLVWEVDGQSWSTQFFNDLGKYLPDTYQERVISLYYSGAGTAPTEGPTSVEGGITGRTFTDLSGFPATWRFTLGNVAGIVYQMMCEVWKKDKPVILVLHKGYPGSGWHVGSGNGLGLGPDGTTWPLFLNQVAAVPVQLARYGKEPDWRGMSYWQGSDGATTLEEMTDDYDALSLPSQGDFNFYIAQRGGQSFNTSIDEVSAGSAVQLEQAEFCETNANGRTWMIGPWYHLPLGDAQEGDSGAIHWDKLGLLMAGEMEGRARFYVEEMGLDWHPLRRGGAITATENTVRIPLERPPGDDFAVSPIRVDWTGAPFPWDLDLLPDCGIKVKRSGSFLTCTGVEMDGDDLLWHCQETLVAGQTLEVSGGAYGPGSATYTHSGVWTNVAIPAKTPSMLMRAVAAAFDLTEADMNYWSPLLIFREEVVI